MKRRYQVFYNGVFMAQHVTRMGAEAHAYKLAHEKDWNILHIEIRVAIFDKTGVTI
jgi:hypothetical protein